MTTQAYLFVGDPFLVKEEVSQLITSLEKSVEGDVLKTTHHLGEASLDQVLADARTLPFLTSAQIFHLKEADALKDKDLEAFTAYLENPAANAYLIFEAHSIDMRSGFAKLMSKHGQIRKSEDKEKKSKAGKWILERVKKAGKTISSGALTKLDQEVGSMPSFLESLVEQLILYAGDQKQITEAMVEALEDKWQEVDVFQLVNAIAGKRMADALILARQITEDDDYEVIGLLGILHWQIRRLWMARVLLADGHSESTVLKKCRISPRQAPFFTRQLKSFSRKKLEDAVEGLFQLDWKMKTGRTQGVLGLDTWLVETTM